MSGSDCIEWTGRRDRFGYGLVRFYRNGRRVTQVASRAAWEKANGPIPDGMFVCHRCDNPPCVNPEHLFLGTNRDNQLDSVAKGRSRHQRAGLPRATSSHCFAGHSRAEFGVPRRRTRNGKVVDFLGCRECERKAEKRYQNRAA